MKKWLSISLQIVLGAVFVVSALTKLYPIEQVELYVYSLGLFSWGVNEFMVRLLIAGELALGLLLISHAYQRFSLAVTLGVLGSLSVFLLYNAVFSNNDNCYCFGEAIPMTPLQSLGKNAILIAIAGYLYLRGSKIQQVFSFYTLIAMPVLAVGFVLIVNGPDSWVNHDKENHPITDNEFPASYLPDSVRADAVTGKRIICLFSMRCKYCAMAGQKLTLIDKRYGKDAGIRYFFFGDPEFLPYFWLKSESKQYPWQILKPEDFFRISDNSMPTIFLVENGIIKNKFGYRGLTEETIREFLDAPAEK